ncbi:cytochrome P450 [Tricholoma matsutake]|nr:cytochrome P450 [Tricholoma matsutake 945]
MSSTAIDPRLAAIAAVALLASIVLFRKRRATPPGPPGLLLLGNIFDLPKKEPWKVYLQWGKQYNSDILSMKVPGTQFFIMNSAKVIQDLLVKRSGIYSDRPRSTMLDDLIQTAWLMVFMNNTDKWKEHRRIFRREFDTVEASAFNKAHELQASRRLLRRLLTSSDHEGELRLAAVDAILSITYGIIPTNFEHPFIKAPEEVNAIFADVARGGYLVDVFPFLKFLPRWFPGVKFHEAADKGRSLAVDLLMGPYKEIKSQVENGTAVSSVASRFLYAVQDGAAISESEIEAMRNVLGNAYLGGADTSVCALYNFVLAMALHPHIQKKAQKALDDVLGGQRLPDFTDFGRLPYLSAIVNEVFRWHPVTPFAVYHVCTQDDVYDGYVIPKGSIMIPNAWAVLQDENIFGADTDKFIPERFMNPDGKINPDLSDVELAFGFGRRACPGKFMARDTLWIMAASMLTAYEISEAVDVDGRKLTAESPLEYTNAMVSFAPHIKVSFKRRIPETMIHDGISND